MCGDYNSVIGMNTENSINRFFKKEFQQSIFLQKAKFFLSGVLVQANPKNGLANKVNSFIFGGELKNIY